ncbi:galactose mutarotase-like protein [Punctularia strigosozonata HHB-11173 SS5]|uniref:galactose mutarotase-like protein n=1 Tax=Punctularia strigosozonata (strain HHB-11173) TaxID=741275 RepID=UPI00044166F8|nr:galactose mutarotase-like protein [Punctularia strigosozonata HHB-11173 SS5]EIN06818.1 galactose mutarotase-like protein [Punctularia strigosozonata HHB-11173 SS5]
MSPSFLLGFVAICAVINAFLTRETFAKVVATENATFLAFDNGRLSFTVDKTTGFLGHAHLDGFDLQGPQSNSSGRGYYECHCVPTDYQVAGSDIYHVGLNSTFNLLQGHDSTGKAYAGVFAQEILPIGHTFQQWYFLRDGETGLHNFARLIYHNDTVGPPFEDGGIPVREIREVFQFNTTLWQTASTNPTLNVSIPSQEAITPAIQVQDATWYLGMTPEEPFVQETAVYWTKYMLADAYRYRKAHGLYGKAEDGTAYGAWLVSVTQDTLFGGPTHYDLLLDGMIGVPEGSTNLQRIPHIYYYASFTISFASSHQGAATSNLTNEGYDRTWGPQLLYFNKGADASLSTLRADAESKAALGYSDFSQFYDSVAHLVPGFEPPSSRGSVSVRISLPAGAENAVAILSAEGFDFPSNVLDLSAYQYWGDVSGGRVTIEHVRPGNYRLTVYGQGVFGEFVQQNVAVVSGKQTQLHDLRWTEESAGTEIWRFGVPDRTAGEFKHGFERIQNESFHIQEYRIYWGAYNFTADFPHGVDFEIGASDYDKDWNYCQFSEYAGAADTNFTIRFDLTAADVSPMSAIVTPGGNATVTVAAAGVSGPTGNEDWSSSMFASFPLFLTVNDRRDDALEWIIPSNISSSCVQRSGISCFAVSHKYQFPADWLVEGSNSFEFGLVHGSKTFIMYDAVRLEVAY